MKSLLLLAGSLLAVFSAAAQNSDAWYHSNALGQVLEPEPSPRLQTDAWLLHRTLDGRELTLTLYQTGKESGIRKETLDAHGRLVRLLSWKDGQLKSEVDFDSSGRPNNENEYQEGQLAWAYRYEFGDLGLTKRTVKDSTGKLAYTDRIYRLPDGRLRRVVREGPQGPMAEVSWIYGPDGQFLEWQRDDLLLKADEARVFETDGTLVKEDLVKDSTVLLSRVSDLSKEGLQEENEKAADLSARRVKDAKGRLILQDGPGDQKVEWTYDDQDRVLLETRQTGTVTEETRNTYDNSDTFVRENRAAGVLVSREHWVKGDKTLVEVFSRGKKVLEEDWKDGEKTKFRVYQNGVLVRERSLIPVEGAP